MNLEERGQAEQIMTAPAMTEEKTAEQILTEQLSTEQRQKEQNQTEQPLAKPEPDEQVQVALPDLPGWALSEKSVHEIRFCQTYREQHPMKCINGRFYDMDGVVSDDIIVTVRRSKLYFDCADHVRNVNKTFKSTRMLKVPPYLFDLINAVPYQSDDEFIVQMGYQQIRNHMTALLKAHDLYMTFHDLRHLNASVMLTLDIPDKYAMERGVWATNSTLKNVYQHTFSAERDQVDEKIDNYFNGILGCLYCKQFTRITFIHFLSEKFTCRLQKHADSRNFVHYTIFESLSFR